MQYKLKEFFMRYPSFLQKNGCIGFIAPSFSCNLEPYKSCFEEAKRRFIDLGYKILEGPNVYENSGIGKSNTPKKCAEEINDFFTKEPCDIIISCGGGETMCEDLSFTDFSAIKKAKAKWFMGYSDNTCLTFTLPTLCDTASIYGPCISSFGMKPWHTSIDDTLKLLEGKNLTEKNYKNWQLDSLKSPENPYAAYNLTENSCLSFYIGREKTENLQFSGRLLGGCLDVLSLLCGTAFDAVKDFQKRYADDGIIWFLESCDLNPIAVQRALWQLENAGWFENAKGFLIGRPYRFNEEIFGQTQEKAIFYALGKYNLPIILNADIGHLPPMMPLICGSLAEIKAKKGKNLSIDHKLL